MSLSTYTLTHKWQHASLGVKASVGAFLLFISAQISIPLNPVPITFTAFMISLLALTYTPRETVSSIGLYLTAAFVGLPVLSNFTGGPAVFLSPRAGYLIGFLLAGYVTSRIASTSLSPVPLRFSLAVMAGSMCLYACGFIGLMPFFDASQAFSVGIMPFIIPGLIKSSLLVSVLAYIKGR